VLLVAKTDEAHNALASLFAAREIEKGYVGLCIGARPLQHGSIEAAVGRSRRFGKRQGVRRDGKEASTEYWLAAYRCGISLLRFRPHTGRTHQIRLHCRHAGFPIIGDTTYGRDREEVLRLEPLDRPFAHKVLKCFARQALHARRVVFTHPFTHETITIEAPFPDDFRSALSLFNDFEEF
jgi:23S rRNA pseudouridine1911/1915/1917 synthase